MVRKMGLAAVALTLVAGTAVTSAAEARIAFNRIAFNRIAFNGTNINKAATMLRAKAAVSAKKTPGEGSVSSVIAVQVPAK